MFLATFPAGLLPGLTTDSPNEFLVYFMAFLGDKKPVFFGLLGAASLLALYFLFLSFANSFQHALEQFGQFWYWVLILASGFGLQVGLYSFIRAALREKKAVGPTAAVAASGGVSTGSMIACCAHHLVDVLPILGLTAAALFLFQYQMFFILLGVFSNIIGVLIMLELIKKHQLASIGFLNRIVALNLDAIKKIAIFLSIFTLSITFIFLNNNNRSGGAPKTDETISGIIELSSQTNGRDGITFEVRPVDFSAFDPVKFEVTITTHSGSLDFDLSEISELQDGEGNEYNALKWSGGKGGHHLSGILEFEVLKNKTDEIKLVIKDSERQPRIFEWNIK